MPTFSSLIVGAGFLCVFHAAFSGIHFKTWYNSLGEEVESGFLPIDIKLEVLLGLVLTLVGSLLSVGPFKSIQGALVMKAVTWEEFSESSQFKVFNHRASSLKVSTVTLGMCSLHFDRKVCVLQYKFVGFECINTASFSDGFSRASYWVNAQKRNGKWQ